MRTTVPFLLSFAALAACSTSTTDSPLAPSAPSRSIGETAGATGVVYTLSNAAAANALLWYDRASDGTLTPGGSLPLGGLGAGAGLGSQGALARSASGEYLYAVNAGSNQLSVVGLRAGSPELLGTVPSGGDRPISVAEYRGLVYVLNGGAANNVTGFRIVATSGGGRTLVPIPGSTRSLSAPNAGGAQVQFTPRGDALIVTEKNTNRILSFPIGADGAAGAPVVTPASGQTPFGFTFAGTLGDVLVVTEAFGGAANASAASSYKVGAGGALTLVSASVPTLNTSACWFAATKDGRYAFTANTSSASITGFKVETNGTLNRVATDGRSATAGMTPIDNAVSSDGRFLYQLAGGAHEIDGYTIGARGTLTAVGTLPGLPASAVGLAAQ